jgi:radical SAM superfamily enzyme YgiQ (UPF0313 family)
MPSVLLIDVPVVPVRLPREGAQPVRRKLLLESVLRRTLLPTIISQCITYSRGVLTVASALREEGFPVNYIVWTDLEDRSRINELAASADIVGFSCMTSGLEVVACVAAKIRSINPRSCIVLGGPHATAVGASILDEIPALDAVVRGDGHRAMVDIARLLPEIDGIIGVVTRDNPKSVTRVESFADAPMPAYDLLYRPLSFYAHSFRTYHGCPYTCNFCLERQTWNTDCARDLQKVFLEIKTVLSSLPKGALVHFSDPVFNLELDRTNVICQWLSDNASGFYLSMDTRVDLLTRDKIMKLHRGGFRYFRIGIESLQSRVLARMQKGFTPTTVYSALRTIRDTAPDVLVHGYWITGFPGSTRQEIEHSIDNAKQLVESGLVDILSNKILVPYPGTSYYDTPSRFGVTLLKRPWSAFDRLSPPVFDLEELSSGDIYRLFCETEIAVADALERRLGGKLGLNGADTYKSFAYLNPNSSTSANSQPGEIYEPTR